MTTIDPHRRYFIHKTIKNQNLDSCGPHHFDEAHIMFLIAPGSDDAITLELKSSEWYNTAKRNMDKQVKPWNFYVPLTSPNSGRQASFDEDMVELSSTVVMQILSARLETISQKYNKHVTGITKAMGIITTDSFDGIISREDL